MSASTVVSPDASRMREARAKDRDLTLPDVADLARREACEADDERWLRTYCGDVFYNPFTRHQTKIIYDCAEALKFGTKKCKAAPRGDGKSSIVKYLALKYALTGQVRFPLILAATASKAKKTLASLKRRLSGAMIFDQKKKLMTPKTSIGEDYPLECGIAAYVDPWPSRARNASANGRRAVHVEWGADWIILPTWEDEKPLGPILYALGITSDDLQGCNVYDQRPDFVMLDDLDSRDSLAAEDGVIAGKIEEAIDKTVAGLSGQNRGLGQFMLCTITSRASAAFKYSDPKLKPSHSGERIRAIIKWPDECSVGSDGKVDLGPLAQTYIELRRHGKGTLNEFNEPVDVFGREAHRHYVENLDAIEAGIELSNPHNYERTILPDGTPVHVSAYQRCLDYIADNEMASFLTEHQNDPPPEDGAIVTSGLTPQLIMRQLNGQPRRVIPDGCVLLTHTTDPGKLKGFAWQVRAWEQGGTFHVIDYGIMDVAGVKYGSDEGLERALFAAVLRRMDDFRAARYAFANGEVLDNTISTFDCRWQTDAILAAVKKCGLGVHGIQGIGRSAGCVKGKTFRDVIENSTTRRKCGTTGAYEDLHEGPYGKIWAIHAHADKWKTFEHQRWLTAQDRPGCGFLFGEKSREAGRLSVDERGHEVYARHICSEMEFQDGQERKWPKQPTYDNDWLDTAWHACCAAATKGIRILGVTPPAKAVARPTTKINLARHDGASFFVTNR